MLRSRPQRSFGSGMGPYLSRDEPSEDAGLEEPAMVLSSRLTVLLPVDWWTAAVWIGVWGSMGLSGSCARGVRRLDGDVILGVEEEKELTASRLPV